MRTNWAFLSLQNDRIRKTHTVVSAIFASLLSTCNPYSRSNRVFMVIRVNAQPHATIVVGFAVVCLLPLPQGGRGTASCVFSATLIRSFLQYAISPDDHVCCRLVWVLKKTVFIFNNLPEQLFVSLLISSRSIPSSDPQGNGTDGSYGNWLWGPGGTCVLLNNPEVCNLNGTNTEERWVASKRRPLAGIYSSTGLTAEGKKSTSLTPLRRLKALESPHCVCLNS